jgi:hypothetical protein
VTGLHPQIDMGQAFGYVVVVEYPENSGFLAGAVYAAFCDL